MQAGKKSDAGELKNYQDDKNHQDEIEKICEKALSGFKDFDGLRLLEFTDEGTFLTVLPPEGSGKALTLTDLEQEIRALSLQQVDWNKVQHAFIEKSTRIQIAPAQEGLKKNGEVIVKVSKDEMEAFVTIFPPINGSPVTSRMVYEALEKAGVVYGIDQASVEEALKAANANEPVLVARGKPAEDGRDAQFVYYFPVEGTRLKPAELENGRVDYYNLNLIYNVEIGQVLATKTPATQGESGSTVTGKPLLPRPGRDCQLRAGKNTELMDEGSTLIASARGHVVVQGNKIHVLPVYEIAGNVDFSTGNIDFVGSVQVRGSIKFGFTVRAEGDVEVRETIEGGSIIAGGNVIVKEGIRGLGKGRIVAKGNIYAKFLENAHVQAGQDVVVGEAIMHSHVNAGGKILVNGRKGLLVGGICRAGEDIEAKIIGSKLATTTELEVGVNPELRIALNQILTERTGIEANLDKVEKALNLLRALEAEGKELPQDKKTLLIKLTRTQLQLKRKHEEVREEEVKLSELLDSLDKGKVKVKNLLHPGVIIRIGQLTYYVRDEMQYLTISQAGGEIKISPYS
ncbi:MAG: FapA family protein [Bacillota bacterium]|nr:FapA family protein [Bacillota bacterium]